MIRWWWLKYGKRWEGLENLKTMQLFDIVRVWYMSLCYIEFWSTCSWYCAYIWSCVILIRKSLPFYSYVGGNFSIWSSLCRVFERSSFGMCMANHWKILKDFPVSYERDNWTVVYPGARVLLEKVQCCWFWTRAFNLLVCFLSRINPLFLLLW